MNKFKNRKDAGKQLAEALSKYKQTPNTLILALPRGGVVLGRVIADALELPLNIIVTRKIGAPGHPEFAIGALTEEGDVFLNELLTSSSNISQEYLEATIKKEQEEAVRRANVYRKGAAMPDLDDRTVIIVDDGIATGYTAKAAIHLLRKHRVGRIVMATPVMPAEMLNEFETLVEETVTLMAPFPFGSVGYFYEDFSETHDDEVMRSLYPSMYAMK